MKKSTRDKKERSAEQRSELLETLKRGGETARSLRGTECFLRAAFFGQREQAPRDLVPA